MAANYQGKSPNRELQTHIIQGGEHPTGDGLVRIIDDSTVNLNDPMEFGGEANNFEGQSADAIASQNLANVSWTNSGYGEETESFNQADAACNEDPGKGGIAYGPRNIGERHGRDY